MWMFTKANFSKYSFWRIYIFNVIHSNHPLPKKRAKKSVTNFEIEIDTASSTLTTKLNQLQIAKLSITFY